MTVIRVALGTVYPYDESRIRGGVEAVALCLTHALAKRNDIELHVVSCNCTIKRSFTEQRSSVTFHWLATGQRLYGLRAATVDAWRVRRVYDQIQPDIIHAQGFSEYALAAPTRVPLVLTVHGLVLSVPALQKTAHFRGPVGIYRRWSGGWIVRRSVQKAKVVISTAGSYLPQVMGTMLAGKIVHNIPNPIADDIWFRAPSERDSNGGVLCVGSIIEVKNTVGLVQAFARVVHQLPEARLYLVGNIYEPEYYRRVQDEIVRLGLLQEVEFRGKGCLDQAQLVDAYRQASIVVLASIQEMAPMALAQAMAVGKPVVATRVGGIPWMVEDGVTGYLVDVGDTQGMADRMVELLRDQPRRQRMGQAAWQAARQRFAMDLVAEKTVQAYRDLLGGRT